MFITLNRIKDSITGSVNGEPFGISYSDDKYAVLTAIADRANGATTREELDQALEDFKLASKENYKELIEHSTPYLFVNKATGKFFLKVGSGDNAVVSSQPLPKAFVDRIIESVEMGLSVLPLVKAWSRFLRNPNYSKQKAKYFANYLNKTTVNQAFVEQLIEEQGLSRKVATDRATTYQTPVTQEGLICTFKVSNELDTKWVLDGDGNKKQVSLHGQKIDPYSGLITNEQPAFVEDRIFYPAVMGLEGGDAFYSGADLGHIIRVGQKHRLAHWSQVDTTDGHCCVKGLHVGNIDYVRGYQGSGTETHNVFVDPMNVGAFTDDGTGAIRVLEYYTHSSFAGVTRSIYHSSEYAKETDQQYEASFLEAAKRFAEDRDEFDAVNDADLRELSALRII